VTGEGSIPVVPSTPSKSFTRKIVESIVVVAAGVGLMAFGTIGAFTDGTTPFPAPSVTAGH
jgi:hypothetical protein